jgi:uncharacterized protein (TIGR02246 family)
LKAIEAIKQLKARYCRLVDAQDWPRFAEVFTPNAVFETDAGQRIVGAAEIVQFVSQRFKGASTVHHALMPEIRVEGNEAAGIWAMMDYIRRPAATGLSSFRGYGHYHESYRLGEDWRIAAVRLTRVVVCPLPSLDTSDQL